LRKISIFVQIDTYLLFFKLKNDIKKYLKKIEKRFAALLSLSPKKLACKKLLGLVSNFGEKSYFNVVYQTHIKNYWTFIVLEVHNGEKNFTSHSEKK